MNITVVGTGYVGLVTGTCFAETGNHVSCVDIDAKKVERMRAGQVPIYEPGLEVLFERNQKAGRLHFTTDLESALEKSTIVFLALPTPPGEDGSADLSYILGVAGQLGKLIKDYKVIVDKSTVPVGTSELVHAAVAKHARCDFDVCSNPEFLREGVAVEDFMKPERVVIGVTSTRARQVMEDLYKPFVRQGNPILFMDERSAEMTKYAANAFLATKISFMNEIACLCELTGANVDEVRKGIGSDSRIGKRFLFPGIGYGGSCFPKDVKALHKTSKDYQFNFQILNSVMEVNQRQRELFVERIKKKYPNLKGRKVAIWGLSFKPNTDDIREAPALFIIDELLAAGAQVQAHDPEAMKNVKAIYGDKVRFHDDMYEALNDCDFLIIATEWSEFRTPDFEKMKASIKDHAVFDGRNLYELADMARQGFYYESIGRSTVS